MPQVHGHLPAVHEAASGRVIHITEGGQRLAAIVPESMLEAPTRRCREKDILAVMRALADDPRPLG